MLVMLPKDPTWEKLVRVSMEAHIKALGHNVLSVPSDLIAQRAVGVAALTILHSDHPERLFPTDDQPELNEPHGVQEGEVATAVAQHVTDSNIGG
ncbi:hypothetical protein [Caudoviricetes sp.]|nr:hypothetical protein [Caudoviricetes sp.]